MGFSEALKEEVKKKAAFKCCRCHEIGTEVHHIIPQATGGPDTEDNAAPLCPNCHSNFGNNPDKRKEIRLMRNWWYAVVAKQFGATRVEPQVFNERLTNVEKKIVAHDTELTALKEKESIPSSEGNESKSDLIGINSPGRTGVVLAIRKATGLEFEVLWGKLVKDLDNDLRNSDIATPFELIDLPDSAAVWIDGQENRSRANLYLQRTKSHLILYGGFFQVDDQLIFSIMSTVLHLHKPTRSVADDIRPLLSEIRFPSNEKVQAFETMRKWLTCVIKYITARGALLSQDPEIASRIFQELLKRDLSHIDTTKAPFSLLTRIIDLQAPKRLQEKLKQVQGARGMWGELPFLEKKQIDLQY